MTKEEIFVLKDKYSLYKKAYKSLKKDLLKCNDPNELYEIKCQMTILGMELAKIRKALIDEKFGRFYINRIIDNFIFKDEDKIQR